MARYGEVMHADGLVLMSEMSMGPRNKLLKWKEAFESKRLKVNLGKTKVMVSGGITKMACLKVKLTHCSMRG